MASAASDWAKVVDAIFQVTKGVLKAIKVYGGRDLAFLGAIAHWLFDLQVWVELPDGTVTYSSCRSAQQAHICLYHSDTEESNHA